MWEIGHDNNTYTVTVWQMVYRANTVITYVLVFFHRAGNWHRDWATEEEIWRNCKRCEPPFNALQVVIILLNHRKGNVMAVTVEGL